jgi:hypothetical protein
LIPLLLRDRVGLFSSFYLFEREHSTLGGGREVLMIVRATCIFGPVNRLFGSARFDDAVS